MSTTQETPVVAAVPEATTSAAVDTTTTETPVVATEPTVESTPAAATTTSAEPTAADAAPATEASKDDPLVKVEATPITSGNLGYKTGPLKLFKYSQRYFWLGDEAALDESTIAHFHKGDHSNKHHTAAHASQTGKGLLLFAKRAEDKTHPEGIFNLSDVTDVVKEGLLDFSFKVDGKKQSFQATTNTERDGWLVGINNAVTDATGAKSTLRETEGYQSAYKKYIAGIAAPGAVGAAASKELGTTDKVHDGAVEPSATATAATTPATTEATKKNSSRSRSRGPLGLFNKQKEKAEQQVEAAKEKAEIKKEEKNIEKEQKKEEKAEAKKEDETAAVGVGAAAGTAVAASETTSPVEAKTPTQKKRGSVFGNIFGSNKKTDETKAAEPVAATAPKVEAPVESGVPLTESVPAETSAVTAPATETAPVATDATAATPAVAATESKDIKKERSPSPKGKLFGFLKSEKKTPAAKSDEPTTKVEEPATTSAHTPFVESVIPTGGATAAEPAPAAVTSTETPAAAAVVDGPSDTTEIKKDEPKKEERRRSIFGFGKSPKSPTTEVKDGALADAPVDDEPKSKKLTNLFRSSSKKAPASESTPVTTATDAPPVPAKDAEIATADPAISATNEAPITAETKAEEIVTEAPATTTTTTTGQPVAA